jgi:hypothetical protein
MRMITFSVAMALLILTLSAHTSVFAEDLDEFTAGITAELAGRSPEATTLFVQANAARDRQDYRTAESLYVAVRNLVPDFDHATRRLSQVLLAEGQRNKAIVAAREACQANRSILNRQSLLSALITGEKDTPPTVEQLHESQAIASNLLQEEALEPDCLALICHTAILTEDASLLHRGVARLDTAAPEWWITDYFDWVVALSDGSPDKAMAALESGRRHGLPEDQYQECLKTTQAARPLYRRILRPATWVAGIWLGGLLVLLGVGMLLSQATLRIATRLPKLKSGKAVGLDRFIRGTYAGVLWTSCVFYYISVPLILLVVVGAGGGLLYAIFSAGRVPIRLVLFIGAIVLVTVWAGLKSLFVRSRDEDPGTRLDLEKQPRLRLFLDEVAEKIATRSVDNVYLTTSTDLAVMERGGVWRQMRGASERCLILGVGVLDGMTLGPFRAILAHEYGHFCNRDTAGGGFALAVRRSLVSMARSLAEGGAAAWYNPAWIFLNGFYRIFLRISQGASRLQEVMADRWAAFAYGAFAFEKGLRHVIERSIRFEWRAQAVLSEVIEEKKPLVNLYQFQPITPLDEDGIARAVEAAIVRVPSAYDSHPSPADRFSWVHALDGEPRVVNVDEDIEVWSLFEDRPSIEMAATNRIRERIRIVHGIAVAEQ